MMRARQTCFWMLCGSFAILSRRSRSPSESLVSCLFGFLPIALPAVSMVVTGPPDGDRKTVARFTDKWKHLSSVNH